MRFCHNILGGKAKEREQLIRRSRFPITRHPDNCPFQTNILVPVIGNTCFHRHASRNVRRQHRLPIFLILGVENIGRGQGNHANIATFSC
ncbi:Uncharacterised protein [Shigella sonnei]|nr:Uncharacterised protein [Shigella sonnei]